MQPELELIRYVEEVSMNALPSLQTLHDDGWVLRFANGYTRRANSVYALYPPTKAIDEKIDFCERMYRSQRLNTVFKMTKATCPPDLDSILADHGYQTDASTSVQLLNLTDWGGKAASEVSLSADPTEAWLAAYSGMNNVQPGGRTTLEQILRSILSQKRFASITVEGQIIACGLGVLQDELIGLYDIVTDPGLRRQGYGYRLIETLLEWGRHAGAQRSYLQVMSNNPPALALYAKLGFREAYQYWYRAKP